MPVADRLAHRHNIGHDALPLEAPEVRAHSPKADLYFVGNADAASAAHMAVHFLEIVLGQDELAATAQEVSSQATAVLTT